MENIKRTNIIYTLFALILISVLFCGCEGRYFVELTQDEVDDYEALTIDFLADRFGEDDFDLETCKIPTAYANRKEAKKDKKNWAVRCQGKGADGTVYNVYFDYNTQEVISYVADHPDGSRESRTDD